MQIAIAGRFWYDTVSYTHLDVYKRQLSILISFLMVLPVLYSAVRTGIESADVQLLEMAQVFRLPLARRVKAIWLPAILPAFRQGCSCLLYTSVNKSDMSISFANGSKILFAGLDDVEKLKSIYDITGIWRCV